MMFLNTLSGILRVRITGADIGRTLQQLVQQGVSLRDIRWEDDLTVTLHLSSKDREMIVSVCNRHGNNLDFLEETGMFHLIKSISIRPVLAAGIMLLFALTVYLPTRVLFFSVEGNSSVPELRILETAEEYGIRFGASRESVRSEQIKNQLLEDIPELKWSGINTTGCTAVISVREQPVQTAQPASTGVSSIVAARDGRITSCTVTKGSTMCAPGQVVHGGQLLVSGYSDCGICIRVSEAEGEIFAETSRNLRSATPVQCLFRQERGSTQKRYSLLFGKKRINLWKGSGISPATCGRMYEEYYITLPGGFRLPVCLMIETLTDWETVPMDVLPEQVENSLKAFARKTVLKDSIAGRILREKQTLTEESGCYVLESSFFCSEMIGRVITEEIGETNGKTD